MIAGKVAGGHDGLVLSAAPDVKTAEPRSSRARAPRPPWSITALAWAVRIVSLFNMLNAVLRYQPKLIFWLGQWVPFEISEGHRVRMFLMSVLLFILAAGVQRGKRLAWQITIVGLLLAPVLHLDRGVIWPQAVINLVLIGLLYAHRRYFVVGSDPRSIRSALIICPLLALGLLVFGTIRLHALHKHTFGDHTWLGCTKTASELVFAHRTWTQTPMTTHALDLFTVLRTGGSMIALLGLFLILRPVLIRRRAEATEREQARTIIETHGNDPFDSYALLGDKRYFFSKDGQAVLSYVLSSNIAVTLADPIGPEVERSKAIAEFAEFCRSQDWEPVFYEVAEEMIPHYERAGFGTFKIGEEARIQSDLFHLKGRDYQNLRTACNWANKRDIAFRWYEPSLGVEEKLELLLADVSRSWLDRKKRPEMAFDMGSFSSENIRRQGVGVALDSAGRALAFASWRPFANGAGRTLDLMRQRPGSKNVMDYVLVESIIRFRNLGIHDISLGNAPLANAVPLAAPQQAEEKAVQFLYENLNRIYGYKSLFEFKRKYRPKWRGRYVAYHRGVHLPLVGLALVRVHAPGGIWKFFMR